ncbi:hypothetical protein F511_19141 [Dorcoceras hygrometricum]|uniref:Uncharacterized protein n=1 Tax=Dorcoceras hygrometricum TaxID=472368 RepID=A0A2Z7BDY1_9LAMI|nr:hypothetical protein F511_19141 [Dorcoceras hygrometricum]
MVDCFNGVVNYVSLVSAACPSVSYTTAATLTPHPGGHHGLPPVPSLRAASPPIELQMR